MTIDEEQNDPTLDALLDDASRSYRVPPKPALEAIWARVEAEAFPLVAAQRPRRSWPMLASAIAASLVLGVAVGRMSARGAIQPPPTSAGTTAPQVKGSLVGRVANDPYQRTTEEFLGRTALLLASLSAESRRDVDNTQVALQAAQLLGTTRLLLDSPAANEPRVRALLEDLELTLAQVARLRAPNHREELALITEGLAERDVVPRIRSVAAEISSGDY